MDNIIISAIQEKKIIELNYHGLHRIVEPHVYGIFNGRECLFVYQIDGDSTKNDLPNWRRLFVDEIHDIQITQKQFLGSRPSLSRPHTPCDKIIEVVGPA